MSENPNRGKRRAARMSAGRQPRTRNGRAAGVTVVKVDPAYLARYGSERAMDAADRNQRKGTSTGNASVLARNASRSRVTAASRAARTEIRRAPAAPNRVAARITPTADALLAAAEHAESQGDHATAAELLEAALELS